MIYEHTKGILTSCSHKSDENVHQKSVWLFKWTDWWTEREKISEQNEWVREKWGFEQKKGYLAPLPAQYGKNLSEEGRKGWEEWEKKTNMRWGSDAETKKEGRERRVETKEGDREVTGNYKNGHGDGRWRRKESEGEGRDKTGHGLVEGYNSRWALYAAALQRSDVVLLILCLTAGSYS